MEIKINNYEYSEETNIIFKNYSVVLDENIENSEWVCKEVYKIDIGYEVYILSKSKKELRELIVRCEDIILN